MDRKIAKKNIKIGVSAGAAIQASPAAWSLYVLRCGDDSLYAGIALDVDARLAQHAGGTGARYTRGRGPLTVAGRVVCGDKGDALALELRFKRLTRDKKLHLVARRARLAAWAEEAKAARASRLLEGRAEGGRGHRVARAKA